MLQKTITYKDLEEKPRTDDFFFNLTIPEVSELEFDMPGGLSAYALKLIKDRDSGKLLKTFKKIIAMAYGEKDIDGVTFNKIHPVTGRPLGERFLQTDAYNVLFMELFGKDSDDDAFNRFLTACVPSELAGLMNETLARNEIEDIDLDSLPKLSEQPVVPKIESDSDLVPTEPEGPKTADQHTREELLALSDAEFDELAGTKPQNWSKHVLGVAFERKGRAQA